MHRDLKPENILLISHDSDVDVKLTDFGLAKREAACKTYCGTPQYFAPEVLERQHTVKGTGRYGPEADMWSVGVVLYVLLSGAPPFKTSHINEHLPTGEFTPMEGRQHPTCKFVNRWMSNDRFSYARLRGGQLTTTQEHKLPHG